MIETTYIFSKAESYCKKKCIWQDALACKPHRHHCPMFDFLNDLK